MPKTKQTETRTLAERDEDTDFWRVWGRQDAISTPYGKLAKAQIDLVIWDIESYYQEKKTAKKKYLLSAVDFLNRRDDDHLSFNWVCETLSLSPGAVRDQLYRKFEINKLIQNSGMLL